MDKVRISNVNTKRMAIASALVCMLLAGIGITNVDAAASKVTLTSNKSSENIMVDDGSGENYAMATLTLTSADTAFRTMEVTLYATWSSGEDWTTEFTDTDFEELEDNTLSLTRGGTATVKLTVYCEENCNANDVNTLTIIGKSDPKW